MVAKIVVGTIQMAICLGSWRRDVEQQDLGGDPAAPLIRLHRDDPLAHRCQKCAHRFENQSDFEFAGAADDRTPHQKKDRHAGGDGGPMIAKQAA